MFIASQTIFKHSSLNNGSIRAPFNLTLTRPPFSPPRFQCQTRAGRGCRSSGQNPPPAPNPRAEPTHVPPSPDTAFPGRPHGDPRRLALAPPPPAPCPGRDGATGGSGGPVPAPPAAPVPGITPLLPAPESASERDEGSRSPQPPLGAGAAVTAPTAAPGPVGVGAGRGGRRGEQEPQAVAPRRAGGRLGSQTLPPIGPAISACVLTRDSLTH